MKIVSQTSWHKKTVYRDKYDSPQLQYLLENIDLICSAPDQVDENSYRITSLKEGDTTTVVLFSADNTQWVVKKYNLMGWWGKLKRALTPSRAARCWHFANVLQQLDINTPAPIAYIEKKYGPCRQEAYLICEYVAGENALQHFSSLEQTNTQRSMPYVHNILLQIKKMHQVGITHGDMKATNILLHENSASFIDLDGMRRYKNASRFRYARRKDLNRFKRNWEENPIAEKLFSALMRDYVGNDF